MQCGRGPHPQHKTSREPKRSGGSRRVEVLDPLKVLSQVQQLGSARHHHHHSVSQAIQPLRWVFSTTRLTFDPPPCGRCSYLHPGGRRTPAPERSAWFREETKLPGDADRPRDGGRWRTGAGWRGWRRARRQDGGQQDSNRKASVLGFIGSHTPHRGQAPPTAPGPAPPLLAPHTSTLPAHAPVGS